MTSSVKLIRSGRFRIRIKASLMLSTFFGVPTRLLFISVPQNTFFQRKIVLWVGTTRFRWFIEVAPNLGLNPCSRLAIFHITVVCKHEIFYRLLPGTLDWSEKKKNGKTHIDWMVLVGQSPSRWVWALANSKQFFLSTSPCTWWVTTNHSLVRKSSLVRKNTSNTREIIGPTLSLRWQCLVYQKNQEPSNCDCICVRFQWRWHHAVPYLWIRIWRSNGYMKLPENVETLWFERASTGRTFVWQNIEFFAISLERG